MRGDDNGTVGLDPSDPRRSRIYLAILTALMTTTLLGALIAILGENVYHSEVMRTGGFTVALVSGGIYLFFRVWGRRKAEAARVTRIRRQLAEDPSPENDGDEEEEETSERDTGRS